MSIVYMSGFEEYPLGRATPFPAVFWFDYFPRINNNDDFRIGPGRYGGQALTNSLGGGGKGYTLPFFGYLQDAVIGFAYKFSVGGKKTDLIRVQDINPFNGQFAQEFCLTKLENDSLCVRSGDNMGNFTSLTSGTEPLLPNRYYYIEWTFSVNNGWTGRTMLANAYNNGVTYARSKIIVDNVVQFDSNDSQLFLETFFPRLHNPLEFRDTSLGFFDGIPQQFVTLMYDQFQMVNWYDDLYIISNTFVRDDSGNLITGTGPYLPLGECNVRTMIPSLTNSPTSHQGWLNVDLTSNPTPNKVQSIQQSDIYPFDLDYITQSTNDSLQTFTFNAVKTGTDTIYGIQPQAVVKAGTQSVFYTTRGWNFWIGTSGGNITDDTLAASIGAHESNYNYTVNCFPAIITDFNTNVAWTETILNTLEVGMIIRF